MRFKNKVALVTGSAGAGIGQATARAFAREGAHVVISDPHEKRTPEIAEAIKKEFGVETLATVCDASNSAQVEDMLKRTIDKFGKVDILVNNAGREILAQCVDMTNEQWNTVIGVCLYGTYLCTRVVLPHMIKNNYGRLIHISSVAGFIGSTTGESHYCAAKAGIMGFSRAVAAETAKYDITSNVVAPGLIMNEFLKRIYPKEFFDNAIPRIPKGRAGKPEDVANAILFFAQEDSDYITGDIMTVAGGMYMHQ
ncbi:MAG: SDR family NAD(P)-dependent oxidoreductase [Thermodesulfobacteriota bacterium]|nr:SDR family NAD(P)-dependent oxidoreductase [Thermodesulfobacteriota bacterium]